MYNRVIYRFIVSRVDGEDISGTKTFERFMRLYTGVMFAGISIKIQFDYSRLNKKAIYIHGSCKYPYEVCMDDILDYNHENAVLTGIDITDMVNDSCLDMTCGKQGSLPEIVMVLDMVLVNEVNCSDMIDGLM
jgi:hypothetical protein